ncbi:hypothetical protein GCM10009616_32170 [Microlunatus lacustris]
MAGSTWGAIAGAEVAATGRAGAAAVRVSGLGSGGASGEGAADVGSVIEVLQESGVRLRAAAGRRD